MLVARCERTVTRTQALLAEGEQKLAEAEHKSALLEKVIALCEKGQSPDAQLQAELQALGVHSATVCPYLCMYIAACTIHSTNICHVQKAQHSANCSLLDHPLFHASNFWHADWCNWHPSTA